MKRLVVAAAFACFAAVLRADPITLTAEESAATRALEYVQTSSMKDLLQ
ncbi:MAG TPA: hypothetical protein VNY25_01380 [Steroidobacteraceae bacterium]|jgi:hypothetical protein|nr:hypothetical protein [Steroidobacteraceae bacterium]